MASRGVVVNDVHGQLNRTRVDASVQVDSLEALQACVRRAGNEGRALSVSGGRYAMGGQQFGTGTLHVDLRRMCRVRAFDPERGQVEVEAGIRWPELVRALLGRQRGRHRQWSIVQKQTGANELSLGGALAANIHGRGLGLKPIVQDVEAVTVIDASGRAVRCSRGEHPGLFRLAIGGYGLFGVIASVRLRLRRRHKLRRMVTLVDVEDLIPAFERRMADGYLYGDCQFAVDRASDAFLRRGVFSCYRPVDDATPVPDGQRQLTTGQWKALLLLAHIAPRRAFAEYAEHYLATSGQIYWSDLHQMSRYLPRYHEWLDRRMGQTAKSTEVITELYVPRRALTAFLADVRRDFRAHQVPVIYGTIRLIERDDETFLAWAREPYACVIFNLHTVHTPEGLVRRARDFRRLIDRAIGYGGSFYLTYHRFADPRQVTRCYPQFETFLRLKRAYDPQERFQSDWYRHYRTMLVKRQSCDS